MLDKTVVYALTANKNLAKEIVAKLGLELAEAEVKHFADGEILACPVETVRGKNVYIVQSTCAPVTERLMEVLIFADALKRASAAHINVVLPYYGYARQDRKARAREPITAKLVADLLSTAGVNRVITLDLHAPQIQGFFSCPVDELSAIPLFGRYFRNRLKELDLDGENVVIVSPDHGGVTRARKLSTNIPGSTIAIIDKRRPRPNVAEVMNIIGDVSGKVAIMLDDIIDTGGTIMAGASAIKKAGASKLFAVCTHGIFSNDAITKLNESVFDEVVTTNTIERDYSAIPNNKIQTLSIAPMIAKVIEHIERDLPVSVIYDLFNQ